MSWYVLFQFHPQDALDFGWWIVEFKQWNPGYDHTTKKGDSPGWIRTRKCQTRRLWSMLRKMMSLGPDCWTMPLNVAFINGELKCAQWKRMSFWSFKIRPRNMFPTKLFVTYFHLFGHQRLGLDISVGNDFKVEILVFQHTTPKFCLNSSEFTALSSGFFRKRTNCRNVKTWTASKDLNSLTPWFFQPKICAQKDRYEVKRTSTWIWGFHSHSTFPFWFPTL